MANRVFIQKLAVATLSKCQVSKFHDHHRIHHLRFNSKIKHNHFSVLKQNLGLRFQNDAKTKMNMVVYANTHLGTPLPPNPSPGHWKIWILGTIFTIFLSLSRDKWEPLLRMKEKVERRIDEAEKVAETVEEVAEGVDKVAEKAAKYLPNGKLRDAAESVEKVAELIDKHAQNAQDALEKVENTEKELESFIESTTDQENTVTTKEAKDQN